MDRFVTATGTAKSIKCKSAANAKTSYFIGISALSRKNSSSHNKIDSQIIMTKGNNPGYAW